MKNLTEEDTKHPLVKALLAKGYSGFELIYDPYWSPDWGWTDVYNLGFLGYNKEHALRTIALLPDFTKGEEWNRHKSYMALPKWTLDMGFKESDAKPFDGDKNET